MSYTYHAVQIDPSRPRAWDRDWSRFDSIDFQAAAAALEGVLRRTPLLPFDAPDTRIELRLKLENQQETGAFKARGAWNQVSQLTEAERTAGVVATSSGNHGKALSWAAQRAGVPATIVMPADAYPNKIEACREFGANVVLAPTRSEAERVCAGLVAEGATLIHPYDAERTVQGAGTVGLEIAQDWPEVEVVIFPVGGGGLSAGSSLALRRELGERVRLVAVEPAGAATLTRGIEAQVAVTLEEITTEVQGLCPLNSGHLNIAICGRTLDGTIELDDDSIHAAQRQLVHAGEVVEPAGAATFAAVSEGALPEAWFAGRDASNPLRVCAVVSGGNPAPDQLAALRGEV
ncbi:MAG: threonine dehydratase [Planctomycetota bacterium]|jgi:threonine dehydratase